MQSKIITKPQDLEAVTEAISRSDWIAVDTEFMRESSYYPKLCLIQLATEEICVCIDVLALKQLDILVDLFTNLDYLKIFHSARQDIEVLFADYNAIPNPIFDTQIATSMLGPDEQISYAELVDQYLSIQLDKTESRTDWSQRPLSKGQINYALNDVRYLGELYQRLSSELTDRNRSHWLEEECSAIINVDNYQIDPNEAWKNVKGVGKTQGTTLLCVQQLASWREQTAKDLNRPRQWILKDRAIIELANMQPHSVSKISKHIETEWPKSLRHRNAILEILLNPIADVSSSTLNSSAHLRLNKTQQSQVKHLMKHMRTRAQELNISPSLLANRKSIENLVLGKSSKVNTGWRSAQIGDELKNMLASNSTND